MTLQMNEFNTYLKNLDYSHVKDLCVEKGKLRTYRKKDFFICQNEIERFAGWVKEGTFQYTYVDEEGEEHIVGYSFTNEFVCDYSSFMKGCLSLVNIQAIADCSVYEISSHDLIEYWETNMETQRFGRYVAENLYEMVYERLLDLYCSPEIRYKKLIKRCPDLKEAVPLKNIASFLGVTPETISRIRRKLEK
jgi:CRP-like cAMP-binding protein